MFTTSVIFLQIIPDIETAKPTIFFLQKLYGTIIIPDKCQSIQPAYIFILRAFYYFPMRSVPLFSLQNKIPASPRFYEDKCRRDYIYRSNANLIASL